jgi:hypothetical protein
MHFNFNNQFIKVIIFEKKRDKNTMWKHRSNSQCFVMKVTMLPHMI